MNRLLLLITFIFTLPLLIQGWNLYSFGLKYQDGSYQYMKYSQHFCNITTNPSACFNDIICIHYETQADIIGLMFLETFLSSYDCNQTHYLDSGDQLFEPGFILGSVNVKMQFSTSIPTSTCNTTSKCVYKSICNYSPKTQDYVFSVAIIPLSRASCNSTELLQGLQ